ncbi:MAG: bifunctional (p)ppGpp synthetase/guanosine-3',5'-bis(diphosphate) 3'-pyrophosphohydrolase [Ruminococcus sp.]|nr:bifunctional (p)ppGpp synthetase/guanosine-3',5'-bis(diphosphate) 3'-pyrophosphohydrolase [Ruminococcus sp.]
MMEEAIAFATKAHEGQFRKGTRRPYIVHPLEVSEVVAEMTDDEEVICAAILHDTIEDCPEVTEKILCSRFGERVARLVQGESEDKSKSWEERKGTTIRHLRTASRELQMIGLADKLSNMRDIDRDYPILGEGLWMRFRMQSRQAIGWYYKGVMEALEKEFRGVPAFEEYCSLVKKYFGDAPASLEWKEERKRRGKDA